MANQPDGLTQPVTRGDLAIRLTPVRDSHHDHDEPLVLDDVQDAVVADPDSPDVIGTARLHRSGTRVRGQ